jgi:hypothetical protein
MGAPPLLHFAVQKGQRSGFLRPMIERGGAIGLP